MGFPCRQAPSQGRALPGSFHALALIALAAAAFGIGTSEFVIMGLLPDVAADLGVSIDIAGL